MKIRLLTIAIVAALAGCQSTLKSEPGPGKLAYGSKVLVDDGTCPAGQIKQVTGGNNAMKIPRKKECITAPES